MTVLKSTPIENFYAEISNKKFGNARNWLKVIVGINLKLKAKFFNGSFHITINSYYWLDPKQLESLKRECPNNLSPFIFFSKLEFNQYYYTKLLENKNYQEIERTMAGCLSLYDPLMYHLYGLYNLEIGNLEKAMTYIFLSGIYTVETEHLANKFQTRFKNADRKQILGVMPNPVKLRSARSKLPSELKEKLKEINIPEWLIR